MKTVSIVIALMLAIPAMAQPLKRSFAGESKMELVNPFIGTGGHGHTFPGATVPYGMVQLSPDTRLNGWDACSGYHSSDRAILGFSHTHLSGTGIGDYGDILFMPTTGKQELVQGTAEDPDAGYCSRKTPGTESASPGYYTVTLQDYGVKAELTATARAGMHRYTYPAGSQAGVIIDVGHTLQSHHNEVNEIEVISEYEIRGYKLTKGWARDHRVFFHAIFSKPFTYSLAVKDRLTDAKERSVREAGAKALLNFANAGEVMVKVGISGVDYEGAKNNVVREIAGWDFNAVKNTASGLWKNWLDKIEVKGGTPDQRKIFYTALYHTAISPNVFTDADGRYRGMDKKIHQANGSQNYTVFSLWDTFRAFHPLMTIINPFMNEEWVRALVKKYEEGAVLPMWELSSNETGTMIGYHAVPVIVDAYFKGYRNFNVEKAYEAIVHSSTYDTTSISFPDDEVKRNLMPRAKYYNQELGFIPCDRENESVSKALEYAYNDWCIAQMAKALGKKADYERFMARSKRYALYFDTSTGFMRGKNSDGTWKKPFNPRFSNHREDEYVEGNAWQWSWFVPHDVEGLVALHGGKQNFIHKLDSLFATNSAIDGTNSSADISGLIGQYAHGNEPSHHIAYLYNYAGEPWKTQELVDRILTSLYFNDQNGLSGNEDCGQMSAWYILSSLGFYQVSPGNPVYTIGRPLFEEVTLQLGNGKQFVIRAPGNNAATKYVKQVKLNGKVLRTPFFSHADLMKGGTLEFTMSDQPVRP
ncbi:GH92 family glycosyl hydrolase [Fulvivirgaceae bacterium PWU4]|uniref:GH92 family glycosyl hydrolase n=1 Tax=Chryseosolibacter histidini TaxID=2782349 RepID=A0AAP2DMC9_9BACT|nr:GH92 family glycosyl hydrolase [Chryseosolibacter histidini]MBT1698134.1 GH92 family glycosyl hydrolase [Chryseosolibacter histidini]